MNLYTLELVAAPVVDGDFGPLYQALDLVPGASLTENPSAPTLLLDVVAATRNQAHIMALGIAATCGFTIVTIASASMGEEVDGGNVASLAQVERWARNAPAPAA